MPCTAYIIHLYNCTVTHWHPSQCSLDLGITPGKGGGRQVVWLQKRASILNNTDVSGGFPNLCGKEGPSLAGLHTQG